MRNDTTTTRSNGFTLTELLLVMGIIVLLFLVAAPGIQSIINTNNLQSAARLIGSAVASARAQAPLSPPMDFSTYQGTALIFTPQHEIRFTRHMEKDYLINSNPFIKDGSGNPLYLSSRNGYRDIAHLDPLVWPDSVGVVGLMRGGGGANQLMLLTPPFAIHFDANINEDTANANELLLLEYSRDNI
ncbi:MAG: pilus assembly FimT family protein, partial [Planctomycetota bacterium]